MRQVPVAQAANVAAPDRPWHPLIDRAMLQLQHADSGLSLWHALAIELSSIIGAQGFESLYSRSLQRANALFPCLTPHPPQTMDAALELLGADLSTRDLSEAREANAALLSIFANTLIVLIGELLTTSILRQAWGDDVVNHAGTEHH